MRVDVYHHFNDAPPSVVRILEMLLTKVNLIMATQAELAADLKLVKDQVAKIGTETTATLTKVTELEEALAASGGTTPEVDAALSALKAQVALVDSLVPDVAPTP